MYNLRFLWSCLIVVLTYLEYGNAQGIGQFRQIAFVSDRDGIRQIYVMDTNRSNIRKLSNVSTDVLAIDCLPERSEIVFSTVDSVSLLDVETLAIAEVWVNAIDPAWSPDGSQIALSAIDDGNYEIYVYNLSTAESARLTNHASADRMPTWSANGDQLAFYSERDNTTGIFVMNSDGSNQIRLTSSELDLMPDWSSKGDKIAYVSQQNSFWNIYTIDSDGSNITLLGDSDSHNYEPDWSPDGSNLLFTSERDGNPEIYMMSSNEVQAQRLTNNIAQDTSPCWLSIPAPSITNFVLVDADADKELRPLKDGDTITQDTFTIRANTTPATVGSVVFSLNDNPRFKVENQDAYALRGDDNGDYHAWLAEPGTYTITATPYTEANGQGEAGTPLTITFTVEAPGS